MNVIKTAIDGVVIIEPKVFGDERGFFLETFQAERYKALAGIEPKYSVMSLNEIGFFPSGWLPALNKSICGNEGLV